MIPFHSELKGSWQALKERNGSFRVALRGGEMTVACRWRDDADTRSETGMRATGKRRGALIQSMH